MTIKQQGGIFGRNPTFNDVDVEGDLTLSGSLSLPNDSISGDAIDGGNATLEGLTVGDTSRSFTGVFIVSSTSGESELRMGDTDTDAGSIAYRNDTNEMTFRTNAAPRATLDGSGNFEPTGNVVLANGQGIDFSATSGTGTSELFDDYEEGTWTPTVRGSSTAGTYELGTAYGTYTKIGNLVSVQARIAFAGSITGGGSGYMQIGGLPFAYIYDSKHAVVGNVDVNGIAFSNAYLSIVRDSFGAGTTLVINDIATTGGVGLLNIANAAANGIIQLQIDYQA